MANRLATETSPYLRQHADNPVDWYPWGDEAFAAARQRDRPILISVGYSSCHWCHVMAHESFEDPDTAALMNELFVNVKVDREERPDVDAVYMEAVQTLTGRGGWPMTVFTMPDGRPFFAGTYFPSQPRGGSLTFVDLCHAIDDLWTNQRDDLEGQAAEVTAAVGRTSTLAAASDVPGMDVVDAAATALADQFDPLWGGFGVAPKFPQAMGLELLLRRFQRTGNQQLLDIVTTTLDAMASGGMYDQLGGGFARYSVDQQWLIPHFEKMLYDQALLARVYLHAWQVTGHERYLQVLTETVNYVHTVLIRPGGGIASAQDADSEGVEGRFYVWSRDEFTDVLTAGGLSPAEVQAAASWWGVTDDGNFEGANILWRPVRGDLKRPATIERARRLLLEARARRVPPGLDDKVLTEWNGLWLSTLAEAAAVTGNQQWTDAAVACGRFLVGALQRHDGRWLRSWQGEDPASGSARHLAVAADHAAVVDAFVRLAELTGDGTWVGHARHAADDLLTLFTDPDNGGLFTTGSDAPSLVARPKDLTDNASPSANGLAAVALARLGAICGDDTYLDASAGICRLVGDVAAGQPTAFTYLLGAVELLAAGMVEVVISGDRPDLLDVVRSQLRPRVVLVWGSPWDTPLWQGRTEDLAGRAYVCHGNVCDVPSSDAGALSTQLAST
jgi:uncharacterized protein YyaL (SSP411 family)